MRFSAYNLSIQSEISLPELQTLEGECQSAKDDVCIRYAKISPAGLEDGQQLTPSLWLNRTALWLHIPRVARFLVRNGNEIQIDPESDSDADSIRLFLLGTAFGALLFQRGHLVLHGNAIRIGDQCMVCVGHSGAGKSTLAAGFVQRGFQILADDVVPVDAECHALPGFPRIKLWQDAADKLRIDTANLHRIHPDSEKFNYPVAQAADNVPLPIRWIYILGSDHIEDIRIEPVQGMQRFMPLHDNTYRVEFLQGMALQPEHLKLCGKLAGKIHLARITRPDHGFSLDQMIDRILADIAGNP